MTLGCRLLLEAYVLKLTKNALNQIHARFCSIYKIICFLLCGFWPCVGVFLMGETEEKKHKKKRDVTDSVIKSSIKVGK